MSGDFYVYILANKINTVLYTGVTNNLSRRVYEHKNALVKGFTKRYRVNKLVYFEIFDSIIDAIAREKQIKAGSRAAKIKLIEDMNKECNDLSEKVFT